MIDWPALVARVLAGESIRDVARDSGVDGRALSPRVKTARHVRAWQECAAAGMTKRQAERHLGVRYQEANRAARNYGLVFAPPASAARHDLLCQLFAEGKGWTEIAAALGTSKAYVCQAGRRLGLIMDPDTARAKIAAGQHRRFGLDGLTPGQLADYRTLRRNGYNRAQRFKALGIADPLQQAAE